MLGVSVAGYHEHFVGRLHMARRRHLSAEALVVQIRAVYVANRGAYGWPRIWRALRAQGIRVGKQRVQKRMRQHGIRARAKRRFRVTTDSRHGLSIAPNLLNRNFTVAMPNQAWSGDITYIPTNQGWLFLVSMTAFKCTGMITYTRGDRSCTHTHLASHTSGPHTRPVWI
jgi:transposase InsO family protein